MLNKWKMSTNDEIYAYIYFFLKMLRFVELSGMKIKFGFIAIRHENTYVSVFPSTAAVNQPVKCSGNLGFLIRIAGYALWSSFTDSDWINQLRDQGIVK